MLLHKRWCSICCFGNVFIGCAKSAEQSQIRLPKSLASHLEPSHAGRMQKILRLEKRSCCLRTNWIVPLTTCLAAPMILFFINWIRPRHQPYNARPRVMKTIVFISSYSFSSSFLKKMGFFGFLKTQWVSHFTRIWKNHRFIKNYLAFNFDI